MSLQPPSAEPANPPDQETDYYIRVLNEMIDIGADLLRMVHQEAKDRVDAGKPGAPERPAPTEDLTVAYERITRSMRRSMMLAKQLAEPKETGPSRTFIRKRIIRGVEDAIEKKGGSEENKAALNADFQERLDGPDIEDEIGNRSIPEIVTDICRDLGIAGLHAMHPWKLRMSKDIAILCARAAKISPALSVPPPPQVDQMEQQRAQQAQCDPSHPRPADSTAQGNEQTDTG